MTTLAEKKVRKKNQFKNNLRIILFYSLSMVVALGINNLMLSLFNMFPKTKNAVISNLIYVVVMIAITMLVVYLFRSTLTTNVL